MANGTCEPLWCKERHDRLEAEIRELWKERHLENAITLEELEAIKW